VSDSYQICSKMNMNDLQMGSIEGEISMMLDLN
jgi:hypothetical protein